MEIQRSAAVNSAVIESCNCGRTTRYVWQRPRYTCIRASYDRGGVIWTILSRKQQRLFNRACCRWRTPIHTARRRFHPSTSALCVSSRLTHPRAFCHEIDPPNPPTPNPQPPARLSENHSRMYKETPLKLIFVLQRLQHLRSARTSEFQSPPEASSSRTAK